MVEIVFEVANVFFVTVWVEISAVPLALAFFVERPRVEQHPKVIELWLDCCVFFVEFLRFLGFFGGVEGVSVGGLGCWGGLGVVLGWGGAAGVSGGFGVGG